MELLSIIFVFLGMFIVLQYFGRYLWDYKVSKSNIQIVLFCFIPVFYISLENIIDIRKISALEMLSRIFTVHWVNKLYSKEYVLISRKSSFFSGLIISPDDADGFIAKVLENQSQKGTSLES
jgi:hypothetical protein